ALLARTTAQAALALMRGGLRTMLPTRLLTVAAVLVLLGALGVGAALRARPSAEPTPTPRGTAPEPQDRQGDPLPRGALMRLGTVQRRAVGARLTFGGDGKSIVGVRGYRYVTVWDAATGRVRQRRELPRGDWESAEFSRDGRWLVLDVSWQ